MEQEQLLKDVGAILETLEIPYAVTGGVAVTSWGRPRFTADIDIVVALKEAHLGPLLKALLKTDPAGYVDEDVAHEALHKHGEFNFIHPSSGFKVDFWVIGKEPFAEEQIRRRVKKELTGQTIFFVSAEDLILAKLMWHQKSESTRQLEDIKSIIAIQKKLDWNYLQKWARIQGTWTILKTNSQKILRRR